MGCGGSKLDPDQDELPAQFKPILQSKLEEIRANKSCEKPNGLSEKELLCDSTNSNNDEKINYEKIIDNNTSNNPTLLNVTKNCPPTLQKMSTLDRRISVIETTSNNVNNGETTHLDSLLSQCGSGKTDESRILRKRHVSEGALDIGMVAIDFNDNEGGELGDGSPSFRMYCKDFPDVEDDEFLDEHVSDDGTADDQRYSISLESTCSNEVSVKHIPAKKGRRRRKFKIPMPKGGKIYKNMQSFYIFPCSSQTNTHLLQKAAA